jgi:phage shock protein A
MPIAEPEAGRPAATGEQWLGRNRSAKQRLWERLNPRSRKQIRLIAEALAQQQTHARLPEPLRARLSAAIEELERVARRIGELLAEIAQRRPPNE